MADPITDIPVAFLRECFDYDRLSGAFAWRARPDDHFSTQALRTRWARHWVGRPAFTKVSSRGYLTAVVTFEGREVQLSAHRVAWALVVGAWPELQIDHANRRTRDNRFSDLREATQSQNNANRCGMPGTASGLKGVSICRRTGRWKATIQRDGSMKHLGYFDAAEKAHAAYTDAANAIFGEFARAA